MCGAEATVRPPMQRFHKEILSFSYEHFGMRKVNTTSFTIEDGFLFSFQCS